jgi:GTP-binding protein
VVRATDTVDFVIADVPGLIEGAADGAGLGTQFLKHLARTRLLLHLVDIAPYDPAVDPVKDARAIVAELKKYDPALHAKPRWLVLNKSDLIEDAAERDRRVKDIKRRLRWKGPVFLVSGMSRQGCRDLVRQVGEYLAGTREGA